jgi:hypothetical protein
MKCAHLRFYGDLADFVSPARGGREYSVQFPELRSVKDLVESEGVPHPEVGLLLVDGASVDFDCLVGEGERVAVYPHFSELPGNAASGIRRPPLERMAFVADVHLGKLVRRLRLLGYDCWYGPDFDDAVLAEQSATENRVLLTRDRGLLMRAAVRHGIFVRSDAASEQLRQVVWRMGLANQPPRSPLCLKCNAALESVSREEVRDSIPAYTYQNMGPFLRCTHCRAVYWKGTHWPKLRRFIDDAGLD